MFEPIPPESKGSPSRDDLRERYLTSKDEYLELCWQYNLPPRDLSLFLMGKTKIATGDRIRLIRLIIQLVDLEKFLGPEIVKDFIFAEDESQYFNSAIFSANLH